MQKTQKIINQAEQNCKAHGTRLTNKRKQILECLIESDKPLSAYELIDHCARKFGESIPAMSVYRILDFLQDENLVHKLNLANKYIACSHISCDHSHAVPQFLICGQCQSVKEININPKTIQKLQHEVEDAGFHLISPQFEMNCICENCLQNTT